MSQSKNPFELLLEQFREIVREEVNAALANTAKDDSPAGDWLKAEDLAKIYKLPKTWFEERGRAGAIARVKPGRYVLFARRDVEAYLQKNKEHKENN